MINVENLKPFPRFCYTIGMIPSSYKESLSYEEQLLWFCNFLENTVIPTVNNNGQATEELQTLFVQLKDYVDNYFTDLNVQTQINNKLDAMAESGELAEIINQEIFSDLNTAIEQNTTNIENMAFIAPSGDTTGETDVDNIQTALNTYKKIRLKEGDYYINEAIKVADHMTIEGNGINSTIINTVGNISAFERTTNTSSAFLNFKDFKIKCDTEVTSNKTAMDFSITTSEGLKGISYSNFERIYIDGFYNGFFAEQFWCTTLKAIRCENCSNYGIFIGGRSNNILLQMCVANYATNGIRLTTSTNQSTELTNINLVNCDLEHNTYGIYAYSVRGLSLKNTYSEYNTQVFQITNCPNAEFVGFYSSYDGRIANIGEGCKLFKIENGYVKINTEQKFLISLNDNSKPISSRNITIENLNNTRIYITNREYEINPGIQTELVTFYEIGQGSMRYSADKIEGNFNPLSITNNKYKFLNAKLIVLDSGADVPSSNDTFTLKINGNTVATKSITTSTDISQFAEINMPRTTSSSAEHENLIFENNATFELTHSNTVGVDLKVMLVLNNVLVGEFY